MRIGSNLWQRIIFWGFPPLLLILVYFSIGFYYENNDDVSRDYALRNQEHPIFNFIVWLPLLSEVLGRLYIINPAFPFYSFFIYGILLVSIYITASFFINKKSEDPEFYWISWGFFLLFFIAAISENVMYLTYTRVAILACGLIILKLVFSEKLTRFQTVILWTFLLIASFIRFSCLNLSFLVLVPAFVIQFIREGKNVLYRSSLIIPVILISVIFQIYETSPEVDQIGVIQKIYDYKYIDSDKIMDEQGKLLLEAIYKWFYADTKIINTDVLRNFLDDYHINFLKSSFKYDVVYFIDLVLRNYFFLLLINLALLIFFYKTKTKKEFLFIVCYYIFFYVMITFISLALKSEPRIIGPSILLFTIVLFVLADVESAVRWLVRQRFFMALVLFSFALTVYKINSRVNFNIAVRKKNEATLKTINDFSKGKVVLITSLGSHISFLDPFKYYPMYMGDKMVRLSGGLSFLPENQKMVSNIVGSVSILGLFQKASNNDQIVLIATEDDKDFLGRYFRFFYNKEFLFSPIEEERFQNEQLKAFVVSQ
ncbi:hypothetical protein MYP_3491 [Sporocytophaga myxococcoides]|uniref:Glycosyltransferase RgtA/B/C/D-like domain-containing protein n=1 Tax=Sporocytophaga myxococcoides TaxID=153721 RepID=A0A098LIR1_9BACT|nr:hypothetical protein [Sporocytophaga myxococcoides]GAL86262.1 hypothetical protein MYP_3491 [Sporocytophaga myxococcoides]